MSDRSEEPLSHPCPRDIGMTGRWLLVALVGVGIALLGAPHVADGAPDRVRPILVVGSPCSEDNFICPAFARALRTTGVRGRIFVRDFREDPPSSLTLLARQGYDVVFVDWWSYDALGPVARRFPKVTFVLVDMTPKPADARLPNVVAAAVRTNEAAFLAGWLAARLEQRRAGPDVVGVVAGMKIPPVDDFVVGFRAGARRASRSVEVLTGYSNDFADPSKCEAIARRQIARGAGVVFNVAGSCGLGALDAAKDAGAWGIGVDVDQMFLGPHVLTSVVKQYDVLFASLIREPRGSRASPPRRAFFGLGDGAAGLGRVSAKVPGSLLSELERVRRRIVSGEISVPGVVP